MINHRVIKAKFVGPTNHKGDRIILTEDRGGITERKELNYSFRFNSIAGDVEEYLTSIGINVNGHGWFKNELFIFSDSFSNDAGDFTTIKGDIV